MFLSKWDKLIQKIIGRKSDLRFEELAKALINIGYVKHQPSGGSSHYTFRKKGCKPITIPKHQPLNKVYIEIVSNVVKEYEGLED